MKRFWTAVAVVEHGDSWSIALDQRPLKTPARATLAIPSITLAEAVASEWRACGEEIDPRTMPMTGLANAAQDHVAPDPAAFSASLARYAEADLLCYRADHPAKLVAVQAASWDQLLAWARHRFDVDFVVGTGVVHLPQPAATVARLAAALPLDPHRLAALSPLVTIGGSLVAALAVLEGAVAVDVVWDAVSLDERWQIEQWGADDEAVAALANRRADFASAATFLTLVA